MSKKNLLPLQKNQTMNNNYQGLTIKDGRLINDRPDGVSGIERASMLRQQMKKQYKIDCIADGIEKAKERKDMRDNFYSF